MMMGFERGDQKLFTKSIDFPDNFVKTGGKSMKIIFRSKRSIDEKGYLGEPENSYFQTLKYFEKCSR